MTAGAAALLAATSVWTFGSASGAEAATTLTVAKDGSGQYTTVQAAVDAIPAGNTARVVVSIAPGTYRGLVKIPAGKQNVTLQGSGAGRSDTVLVYDNASGTRKPDGSGTYGTSGSATVAAEADGFQARNLTISNDFDEAAHQDMSALQAVALRTAADKVFLGDATLDPMATFRNSTLGAAVKSAPWTDMSGFSWKDDRFAEYKNTGPGSGAASSDRPQLTDAQAADQETADWLAGWTPSAS